MSEISRLNGTVRALVQGQPAFVTLEIGAAQSVNAAPCDGVVFEMEHNPYDIQQLRTQSFGALERGLKACGREVKSGGGDH